MFSWQTQKSDLELGFRQLRHFWHFAYQSKKTPKNPGEQGSVAVLVTLGLTALLGFGAIVTDLGMLYAQKARLQNALDAAALAGVQELPNDPDRAAQIAEDYASRNDVPHVTVQFEDNNTKIIVSAQKASPTYFAKIWGINSEQISARSAAMMLPPTSLSGAVPLSIEEQDFVYGEVYTLKSGSGNTHDDEPGGRHEGWFGALELSRPGARDYETDLAYGYRGTLRIGQVVDVKHGNMSGPTMQGVNARFAQDTRAPRNTFNDNDRNAPEIMYVPIVKIIDRNGKAVQQVQIVGFAAFFLEGVAGNGNDSIITGRFIKTLAPGGKTGGTLADLQQQEKEMEGGNPSSDFGLYTPKLVED